MSDVSTNSQESGLSWSGMTHTGRFRKNNEDAFLALTFDALEVRFLGKEGESLLSKGDFIFAVSDGMGGAKAGEFASRVAVDKITELLPRSFEIAAMGMDRGCGDILGELFERIHEEMTNMSRSYEELKGMGATLSLCWFTPGWVHFAHVGDSRIYYLPDDGEMKQLTEDHTHVAWLLQQGKISESEARRHPERNILHQVVGGKGGKIAPHFGSIGLQPGDRFVLCSDGIYDAIRDHRIETLVRNPVPRFAALPMAERLVVDALEESGRDNLTAVVVEVQ